MTKLIDTIEPEANTKTGAGLRIQTAGALVLRYGLVLVIGWIGLMKFTGYEAKGIEPMVAHSPFMGWMYSFLSVQTFSDVLGAVEVAIALLIGLRPWSAKASALGSAGAVIMFLTTLSFLFSTPGWEPSLGGFPALSGIGPNSEGDDTIVVFAANRAIQPFRLVTDPELSPLDLAIAPNGNIVVSSEHPFGSSDAITTIREYDAFDGHLVRVFSPGGSVESRKPRGLRFAPDGRLCCVAEDEVVAFDFASGECLGATVRLPRLNGQALVFFP